MRTGILHRGAAVQVLYGIWYRVEYQVQNAFASCSSFSLTRWSTLPGTWYQGTRYLVPTAIGDVHMNIAIVSEDAKKLLYINIYTPVYIPYKS